MPNYNEEEMRMLANLLGKPALRNTQMVEGRGAPTTNEREFLANALQNPNRLPIPMNENNVPMFATDAEYMQYLNEYDPEMFMQMQNEFYNTRGSMGEGRINPLNFIKGLLGD